VVVTPIRLIGHLAAGGDGAPAVDPDEARRTADDILDDAAYAEPTQSLLDRAVEWIGDRLGQAFDLLPGTGPGSGVAWVFVVALVALAAWLLVRALRAPSRRRSDEDAPVRYGTETARDAAVWLDEAARLAAAGDHRGALRCRHQALVARLVTDGVVADVSGRTAGEYERLAALAMPDDADRLRRLTDRFDGAWYGGHPVDADAYAAFEDDCRAVESRTESVAALRRLSETPA
jgi:hypothetical protein